MLSFTQDSSDGRLNTCLIAECMVVSAKFLMINCWWSIKAATYVAAHINTSTSLLCVLAARLKISNFNGLIFRFS